MLPSPVTMLVFPAVTRYSSVAILLLRLAVAALFLFHGSQKWALWSAAPQGMSANMVALFKGLSVVEPLLGVLLLIGLFTQLAALILAVVMVGAIYFKITVFHVDFAAMQTTGWEFDLMILVSCIVLFTQGAGRYSVDGLMDKKAPVQG